MKKHKLLKICKAMGDGKVPLCINCSLSGYIYACNVLVPSYIPPEQIKKFIELIKDRISHEKPSY